MSVRLTPMFKTIVSNRKLHWFTADLEAGTNSISPGSLDMSFIDSGHISPKKQTISLGCTTSTMIGGPVLKTCHGEASVVISGVIVSGDAVILMVQGY